MTPEQHKARHAELHTALDELFADFIQYGDGGTDSTILELIQWSHKQTQEPDHDTPVTQQHDSLPF